MEPLFFMVSLNTDSALCASRFFNTICTFGKSPNQRTAVRPCVARCERRCMDRTRGKLAFPNARPSAMHLSGTRSGKGPSVSHAYELLY